jgi:hypothetical protein
MRRVGFHGMLSHDATIFVQKIVACEMRWCVGFSGMLCSFVTLCSPNEDFGRPNEPFRVRFRSTFQRFVAVACVRACLRVQVRVRVRVCVRGRECVRARACVRACACSRAWKVLRKRTRNGSFGLPKSSFGRGKLCKVITKDSRMLQDDDSMTMCRYNSVSRDHKTRWW